MPVKPKLEKDTRNIEKFAAFLVEHVRDRAIRNCDARLSPEATSTTARRWRELRERGVDIHAIIPDMVDSTVAGLLAAMDEGIFELEWEDENGARVDLTAEGEGEMCGWYMGSESWREMYAKERYVDYFADLRGFFDREDVVGTADDPPKE